LARIHDHTETLQFQPEFQLAGYVDWASTTVP